MTEGSSVVRLAAKRALELRARNGIRFDEPCDIYELIHSLGVELQFVDIPSLEGMYLYELDSQRICVSTHRPSGRQRYTAAHELGHHVFVHGSRFDPSVEIEVSSETVTEAEILADAFARYVLMPWRAVQHGFRLRGADPENPNPLDIYRVACWLGVGYGTLVYQMRYSLNLLRPTVFKRLSKVTPKKLKAKLAGIPCNGDVWPLDDLWGNKRLHAQIGDLVTGVGVQDLTASDCLLTRQRNDIYFATTVGEGELPLLGGGRLRVSVSKAAYVGFYEYRYLLE